MKECYGCNVKQFFVYFHQKLHVPVLQAAGCCRTSFGSASTAPSWQILSIGLCANMVAFGSFKVYPTSWQKPESLQSATEILSEPLAGFLLCQTVSRRRASSTHSLHALPLAFVPFQEQHHHVTPGPGETQLATAKIRQLLL